MKYFPFKIIIFCILFVPLLFTITVTEIEKYLNDHYKNKIQDNISYYLESYLDENSKNINIQNAIDKSLKNLSDSNTFFKYFSIIPNICVKFKNGGNDIKDVNIILVIPHNSIISNAILIIYIALSLLIFYFFYKKAVFRIKKDEIKRKEAISSLVKDEQEYIDKLESLKKEREILTEKLAKAKLDYEQESKRASIAEEELFNEILQLEKKVEENTELQKEKESEIEELKSQLEKLERRKGSVKKRKSSDGVEKRFLNLYKNIDMNKKAVEGLLDLDDDMQLKAEEVIHQLNEEPSAVLVKRKVFTGKKNKTASFEVLFAYNGRLYFRNIDGNRIEILVIETKNSQDKDMEFLHSI